MTSIVGDFEVPAPPKPVGAVIAALSILRCLGRHESSMRLYDIARQVNLNRSTTLNILRTLEYEGLVNFDRRAKHYRLSGGLADLAAPVLERADPLRRFIRAMDAAAHGLGATVALWRRVGDEIELTHVSESPADIRITYTVGRRLPSFLGAVGRLVAARGDWSSEELKMEFDRLRWAQAPDFRTWLAEVEAARERGSAVDPGNVNRGILGVAVPVEKSGPLIHILAATMFETELTPRVDAIVDRLVEVADLASADGVSPAFLGQWP